MNRKPMYITQYTQCEIDPCTLYTTFTVIRYANQSLNLKVQTLGSWKLSEKKEMRTLFSGDPPLYSGTTNLIPKSKVSKAKQHINYIFCTYKYFNYSCTCNCVIEKAHNYTFY